MTDAVNSALRVAKRDGVQGLRPAHTLQLNHFIGLRGLLRVAQSLPIETPPDQLVDCIFSNNAVHPCKSRELAEVAFDPIGKIDGEPPHK